MTRCRIWPPAGSFQKEPKRRGSFAPPAPPHTYVIFRATFKKVAKTRGLRPRLLLTTFVGSAPRFARRFCLSLLVSLRSTGSNSFRILTNVLSRLLLVVRSTTGGASPHSALSSFLGKCAGYCRSSSLRSSSLSCLVPRQQQLAFRSRRSLRSLLVPQS